MQVLKLINMPAINLVGYYAIINNVEIKINQVSMHHGRLYVNKQLVANDTKYYITEETC